MDTQTSCSSSIYREPMRSMHVRVRGIFSVLQFIWNHVEKKFQQKCSNPISKSLRAWRLALGTFSSPTKRLARPTIWCRHDQQTQCLFVLSNRSDFALWRQGAGGHVDVRRYFSCRLGTHPLWYLFVLLYFLAPSFTSDLSTQNVPRPPAQQKHTATTN